MNIFKNAGAFIITAVIVIGTYLVAGQLLDFSQGKSPIIGHFIAAILGSIITVAILSALIRVQTKHEIHREFSSRLFEQKLNIYRTLVETIFKADDDNAISRKEVQNIENQIGVACLVAGEEMVSICAQFLFQLKTYGVLYYRSMINNSGQKEHFESIVAEELKKNNASDSFLANSKYQLKIPASGNAEKYFVALDDLVQAMRRDLNVVDGDIKREIEHFVRLPYDKHKMITNPNLVDADISN